jgi:predicted lipoprotein with Yx(FWY)xxD motif/cytochrome c5
LHKPFLVLVLVLASVLSLTTGQETPNGEAAAIQVTGAGASAYLVNQQGMSLYVYLEDTENTSNCYDACAANWQPLTVEGEPAAGTGVDVQLLGTTEREDGTQQVTYGGRPLYTYVRDENPGDTNGQGVGDLLYVVSPSGEPMQGEIAATASGGEGDEQLVEDLVAEGEPIFTSICATCHGAEGEGLVGPRLDGNQNVGRASNVINTILYGRTHGGMPAFGDQFSDREVAAVGTFVRNSWSNEFGAISEEEVNALR